MVFHSNSLSSYSNFSKDESTVLSSLPKEQFIPSVLCNLDSVLSSNCSGEGHSYILSANPLARYHVTGLPITLHTSLGWSHPFITSTFAYMIVTDFCTCHIRWDISACISHRHFKVILSKTISSFSMLMIKGKKKQTCPFPVCVYCNCCCDLQNIGYWALGWLKSLQASLIKSQG